MSGLTSNTYGNRFAEIYDQWANSEYDPYCIDTLAAIAGNRPALELGIGTGRIALPLASRGCRVSGIDISPQMLEKLRAKEGAARLSIICGSFVDIPVEGHFDLIYCVGSSFYYLLTREDQLRCFRNVSHRLASGGAFVIETWVPQRWMLRDNTSRSWNFTPNSATVCIFRTSLAEQLIDMQVVRIDQEGTRLYPDRIRFVWPSEFDLLAQTAGLRLDARWGS